MRKIGNMETDGQTDIRSGREIQVDVTGPPTKWGTNMAFLLAK